MLIDWLAFVKGKSEKRYWKNVNKNVYKDIYCVCLLGFRKTNLKDNNNKKDQISAHCCPTFCLKKIAHDF